jgi:NADH:ubiquinone oxidoreductase subunit K
MIIGILGFIGNNENLVMLVISLELILLSIGFLFIQYSFILDDLIGANITLFLLPLAGAESAIALAILVAYYPIRGSLEIN